jgi:hypothetical protein
LPSVCHRDTDTLKDSTIRANRHSALNNYHRLVIEIRADLIRNSKQRGEVSLASNFWRSPNGYRYNISATDYILQVSRKQNIARLLRAFHCLTKPWLKKRNLATIKPRDFCLINVNARDRDTKRSKTNARCEPNVTSANHYEIHTHESLSKPRKTANPPLKAGLP